MPTCHHLAPNGEKSLLFAALEQKYGSEKAHDVWEQVRSQQFLNRHGNWMGKDLFGDANKSIKMELDVNGEPTLPAVETRLNLKPAFKPANNEQVEAIQGIQDFIRNGNPGEWFTLEGKAGTGKTTLVQEALAPFIQKGSNVLIAALAHKAKLVLSNKLQERFGDKAVTSHTIASMLAMGMDVETGKFSPEFGAGTPPIMDADIIVVDEASMVNEEALALILEHKTPYSKVIFLGDIGQLPPIREGSTANKSKPSPVFTTKNKAKLLERVRQGEESPILPYADLFWNNSQSKTPVANPAGEDMRKSHVSSKGSLVFASSKSVLPKILPFYKKAVESGNPDIVKTVVYKNATRQLLNKNIRQYIFGEESKKQFVKGDLLMFQDNYALGPKTKVSNSTEIQVQSAKQTTTMDGWKVWDIGFGFDGNPVQVSALDTSEVARYKENLDAMANKAKAMPKGHNRTVAWKEFYAAKSRFAPVDYAYAITSHKSQGSTYDMVLVGESDIMSVGPTSNEEKSQSIYTAITRARHAAFIMDGKHDDAFAVDLAIQQAMEQPAPEPKVEAPLAATPETPSGPNPAEFENHSGGAEGGDTYWDIIGRKFGVTKHNHYREPGTSGVDSKTLTKAGVKSVELSKEDYAEGIQKATKAAQDMGRRISAKYGHYQYRNWAQVKYTDAIFATGTILQPGDVDPKGYTAKTEQVSGGTGYAVQMAINEGKPVYVFDQKKKSWFKWSTAGKTFVGFNGVPTLTKNFAGIGSRQTNVDGMKAIQAVYEKTFNSEATPQPVPQPVDNSTPPPPPGAEAEVVTKEVGKKGKRVDEAGITKEIDAIYAEARSNPDKIYKIPYEYVSQKHRYSNNYNARELANLFDRDDIPQNIQFTDSFRGMIENSYRRIIAGFKSDVPVELIGHEREQVVETAANLLIPKLDAAGNPDGYFTPSQQKEIVDSLVSFTERLYRRDPNLKANALIKALGLFRSKQQQLVDSGDTEKATIFTSIYEQRERLAEEALRQLEGLGLHTDERTVNRILDAVREMRPMTAEERADFQSANPDVDMSNLDEFAPEFMEATGRMARDWSDNTFELDPKDTASARIKMFMGTLYEMDKGIYAVSPTGVNVETLGINLKDIEKNPTALINLGKQVSRRGLWFKDEAQSKKLKTLLDQNAARIPKENFLGIGKTAEYDQIFKETLNTLGNKSQKATFDDFMQLLDKHSNPTIQHMAGELRRADQSMKNEFMTVMMKQYQPFVMALFNTTRDASGRESYVLNPIEANRYNQRNVLIKEWQNQQKLSEITILSPSGERVLDVQRIQKRWLPLLKKAQDISEWGTGEHRDWFIKTFGGILRMMGVGVSDEMMAELHDNTSKWTNAEGPAGLFTMTAAGEPTGMLSIFIMKAAGKVLMNENMDMEESVKLSQRNNPLYTEKTTMQALSKLVARYTPVLYSENHRNTEGKSVWDWGMNTKLSHQFRNLKQNFPEFYKAAESTDISRNNYLLKILKENPVQIGDLELAYFDGLKPTWGKRGTTRQAMSDREQLLTSILLFQNHGYGFERKSKVHFMSLTHSDKTMTPVFKNMPKLNVGRMGVMSADIIGRQTSALFGVFKSEYDRILKHASIDSGSRQYEKGKGLFYFLPEFNYDGMASLVQDGIISQEEMNLIYPGGQRSLTKVIDQDKELPVINKVLLHFARNLVDNTLQKWTEHGIITEDSYKFDKDYVRKLLYENGVKEQSKKNRSMDDNITTEFVDAQGNVLSQQAVTTMVAETAAKDYAINHFLFNTSLSQLLYGDPAEAFKKSKEGNTDIDNVRSTMVEYAKRLAKDIAPRTDLYWGDKRTYNTVTLADVNVTEKYLAEIEELKKAYAEDKTNSTDAQELVTVQEKLDVLNAAGKIPSETYAEMSAIITKAKGGFYKFEKPEHLAIVMQPEKPLYAGQRAPVNGIRLTDYIKSSAYALYPPLTAGREIDGLRRMMETNNIQRADYESARKLGTPAQPLEVFSAEGKFLNPGPEKVQGAIRQLDRSGFGIQQEVPYDPDKEAIKTITQMNENIVEGIGNLEGFEIPGHGTLNGKQVKALKESVRKKMLDENLRKYYNKLNIDEDGNIDPEYIFDVLVKEAQADTRNTYTLNEIQSLMIRDKDGTPMIPLMFSTAASKYESLLMGMVNKIAEVKMPGKSFVQASSTGYRVQVSEEADLSNITWVGDYDGSPLKALRIESGKVLPGQVILPWNFFAPDGTKLRIEDFLVEKDGKKYLDPIRVPKELLQLVGARIPNQKHSSMHPIEVVGFVPENMGDMVLIPAALVKQMGGDFDVDKLYTYKRPYYFNKDTGEILSTGTRYKEYLGADAAEWSSLKAATTAALQAKGLKANEKGFFPKADFNKALGEVVAEKYPDGNVPKHRTEVKNSYDDTESLQNDYFNIHWAVLTHPDMVARVLAPLDKSDLSDESSLLRPARASYWNYFDPMTQLEDFQSGKDAKRLVGSTSWAVKFSARIQDKNLRYGQSELIKDGTDTFSGTYENVDAYIPIKDEHTGVIRSLGRLSGTGTAYYTKKDGGEITKDAARSKSDNHVMVQSESVDNAKNRVLDNLNLTPDTYKAVQALIELQTEDGWAANSKYWTRLLTQPIIWEFSKEMKRGNDSLSDSYDPFLYNTVYNKLLTKYESSVPALERDRVNDIVFDPQLLLKAQTMTGDDFYAHQVAALKLFNNLYQIGQRMFELEAQFNQDVSGAGRDLFTVMDKARKLQDIDQLPILGASDLYRDEDGLTEVGHTYNATAGTALRIVSQVLPYRSLQPVFNKVMEISGKSQLTIDNQRAILKAFRSMAYTSGQHWWGDPQAERVRLLYGKESLGKRILAAQKTWGRDNPFLVRLTSEIGNADADPDFVEYNAAGKAMAIDRQNMTTGWLHLLLSDNEEQRRLGEDLLRYSFLTGGIQDANSFVEFAPAAYIAGTEFSGMLKDIEYQMRTTDAYENDGFIVQLLQHNPEMAFPVTTQHFGDMPKGREFPETFAVPRLESPEYHKFENLKGSDGEFRPFLSFRSKTEGKWILFMKNQIGDTVYYTRVDTLGNQYTDEYNGLASQGQRSIFQENRSFAERIPALSATGTLGELKNSSLRNFNNKVSSFDQIGIRTGGAEAITDSLSALEHNREIPEYLRTVAGFFKNVGTSPEILDSQKIMETSKAAMGPLNFGISYKPQESVARASFFGHISLNPEFSSSKEETANVFLHEVGHTRLQWLVVAAGYDDRVAKMSSVEEWMRLMDFSNDFKRKHPEVIKHLDALDRLRYEALNSLREKVGEDRFNKIAYEVNEKGSIDSKEHLYYYATSSLQEFVAHLPVDRDVAAFLNDIQTKENKSLLSQVWDVLTNLLTALGKAMGVQVKDGSVLKEALTRVMAMHHMDYARNIDMTTPLTQSGRMEVGSQKSAEEMWELFNFTYGRPTEISTDGLSWAVDINNEFKSRKNAVPGQRGRVLDKLLAQKDDISEALNREKDLKKRVQLRVKYREIREQINELQQTNDINKIAAIGNKQLEWVDQVLKNPNPTTVDVNLALNTAHIWENLLNILYGDLQNVQEVSNDFIKLQAAAQTRRIELLNTKAQYVLTQAFQGDMPLTPLDFKSKLEDIDMLSANTLALTRAKPKLVQATATLGWREANNRDEHIYRNTQKLQALEKKMKEAGLTNELMLDFDKESGNWGLVNRLSGTWYQHVNDQRSKLNTILDALDKSENLTDKQRGEQKRTAWNNYWTDIKKTAVFVDSRSFFDIKNGNRLSGESFDKALAKLTEQTGSEAYSRELVQKAEEKYKAYLSEREAMSEWLDGTIELTEEEKADKTADEQKELLKTKKETAMTKWLQYNSPVDLLNRLDSGKNINFNSDGDQWIVMTPKKSQKQFFDERYQKIEANSKMKEAYNEYREILTEMISYLPMEVQQKLPDNFLPIVPKDTANFLAQVFGKIRNWDTEMLKALAATDAEEASRLRPDKIPVMYTQARGSTKDISERSTDVVRVLELFSMMALQHRYMGNVLDTINVAEGVIREVNTRRITGMEEGKPLRHIIDAMKYFKDALVFKKPKELQGKIESPMYSMNPAVQIKIEREIKALLKEKEDLNQKMEEKMTEGDFDTEAEDKRIEAIDKQLTEYEKGARNIYGSKVVDALISINQMKALGYNPFSAVSNFTFAAVSVMIHARGRTDFDPKTTREAWGIMTHSVKKYWMFNEMGDETAQKVHALMNRAGIMGDVTDAAYGNNTNISSRKHNKLQSAVQPFNWQKSGDYFTKGVLMVAMLKKKMVEYTEPGTGTKKEISLWDALDKEGKWNTEKYGARPEWYSDDIHEQTEWNRYRDRMRKVSMMVFGNQDKNSPLMAKKNWLLRTAAQFRLSWFPEGIATRWKAEYEDANLGRSVKGRWRTYQDLGIVNSGIVLAKQMLASLPGVKSNPFDGITLKDGKALTDSAIDVENMRKNFAGLAWTVGLTAAILMLEATGDDQHKKDAKARRRQLLINMLIRNHQDLMLYSSPSVFNTISGNFLPATQVIVDYVAAMKASGHYFFGDTHKEKHAFETWYKKIFRAGLPHPTFTLYNKVETMMTRDLDKLQR